MTGIIIGIVAWFGLLALIARALDRGPHFDDANEPLELDADSTPPSTRIDARGAGGSVPRATSSNIRTIPTQIIRRQ